MKLGRSLRVAQMLGASRASVPAPPIRASRSPGERGSGETWGRWPGGLLVGRRRFPAAVGAAIAWIAAPLPRVERARAALPGRFFTRHELATLEALCDHVIPPDHDPGASDLGAPRYIEGLLTAF